MKSNEELSVELSELNKEMYKCEKCELCKLEVNKGEGKLRGEGSRYKIMCVAQNPSINRKSPGVFLKGSKNNDLFIKMMELCGFRRESYYVTNLVKCSKLNNDELSGSEIKCCNCWVRKEIELLRPRVIICIGSESGEYFDINKEMTYRIGIDGIIYFKVQHPSYILRNDYDDEYYSKEFIYIKDKMHELGVYNDG